MEIKTTFQVIMGILIVAAVITAAVLLIGVLLSKSIFIKECIPSDYTAKGAFGVFCGFNSNGDRVYCNPGDECMDQGNNRCCPTSKENVSIIYDRCCNISIR